MATIDGLGLQEPSTITKSLAVIPITRNSSVTYQEIMVIGDPDSTTSSAVAKVTNAAAASTAWGLVTRPVGPITVQQSTAGDLNVTVANFSTTVNVSSLGGAVNIRSSAANALVSVYQSTAADLNVTVAGYSTTVNVSSLGGAVIVRSSAANALVTVYQSTAADLNVTVAGYSTIVAVSSLGGRVTTMPLSTVWASSAGFHFDSSGALLTNAAFTGSTTVSVARTVGNSSAADYMPVRLVDSSGTGFLAPGNEYSDGSTQSTATGPALMFNNGSNATMRMVGVAQPLPIQVFTSSGASAMDSTEGALKVNVVAGAAGGSTIMTVSTGSIRVHQSTATDLLARVNQGVGNSSAADRWRVLVANSSAADFIGMRIVDSSGTGFHGPASPMPVSLTDSSNAVVKPGDSANNALRVNVVAGAAGGSTEVTVRQSTYTDFNANVRLSDRDASTATANITNTTPASTAYGLVVREAVAQSTGPFVISSIVGPVNMRSSAANALVTVYQSTAADLNVTVAGYSTIVAVSSVGGVVMMRLQDSSGVGIVGSTGPAAVGVNAMAVRQVNPTIQSTTTFLTSSNSTALYSLISSVASVRHKVFAYIVQSTHTTPSTIVFMSSNAIDRWSVCLGSGSSGVTGANLAVSPPAWLFHADAANALNCRIENTSTQVLVRISLSWFDEA